MNYKDLELKNSYISCGDVNIVRSFLVPALECTKVYKRSFGFFSSGVFELLMVLEIWSVKKEEYY